MNFATLPPEINSGRMYEGPGSGSMTEAATAWERLATRLYTAAADYHAVTATLAAMPETTAPYIDWLTTTGAHARHAATRAAAAASAYETALAAMVPPPAIDANRARRRSLAVGNCLGQTSPAIADAEAHYEQMWAANADAMHAYAGASADASTMTPFTLPDAAAPANPGAPATTWAVKSAPEVVSAGRQVMTAIPEALQALSMSPRATFDTSLRPATPSLSRLSSLSAPSGAAISRLNSLNKAAALRWLLPNQGGARGPTITARFGRGTSIGGLSAPQSWATAATTPTPVYRGTVA
jgi:PPE-repeat protein